MFHIVFNARGAEMISAAMDLDDSFDGEIVLIRDDYSVGPIQDLFTAEGRQHRQNWWSSITQAATGNEPADADILEPILVRMQEEAFDEIWIWIAPNACDVSGYFWLVAQLIEFVGRVFVIHLNNLPFIGEKGNVFYPLSLAEIPPREFIKAKKLVRLVTTSEFETDPDEWFRLALENKNLRKLEGGKKIIQLEDHQFDKNILQFLQPSFQKIHRIVQQFLLKSPEKLNESFITWRLKELVAAGSAEQQGESVRRFAKESDEPVTGE